MFGGLHSFAIIALATVGKAHIHCMDNELQISQILQTAEPGT